MSGLTSALQTLRINPCYDPATSRLRQIRYRETGSGNREVLRDKSGRILGRFESDTGVTRDASGKIIGRGQNQLLRLLKQKAPRVEPHCNPREQRGFFVCASRTCRAKIGFVTKEPSFASTVMDAINTAFRTEGHFSNEKEFQSALYDELRSRGPCKRECRAEFGPACASAPTPPPPFQPIDICEVRGCRKVDLLATLDSELVAIELKFSRFTDWKGSFRDKPLDNPKRSDVVEYGFLKDIQRMERLKQVTFGEQRIVPRFRVCALVSNNPFETEGRTHHERMRLCPRTLAAGHLVQYNATSDSGKPTSPNTLWRDYPPFCLAQSYVIGWCRVDGELKDMVPADDERRPYPPFQVLAVDVSLAPVISSETAVRVQTVRM
jgi:hypothetical protein